ncbi:MULTISPECIES: winged helix-turn-helix transcriptional regulator [unclassified Sphingobacterium]|uniref:winged helix-turn-helix transcriptional regulator n=1 Tax=unclassified Sphingobacterium TaxID=2609468 RepID=UPI0025F180EE|nr:MULTISPECIES: helix-turn-helix domain-containing protein [unclassified Sphingobacterium]
MTRIKACSTNFSNKKRLENDCPEVFAANVIGGQWALAICCYLINGSLRYTEIRKCLPSITERMLTLQLRKLEEHRVVKRHVYAEVPARVMYELTKLGYPLRPIIEELGKWGEKLKQAPEFNK